MKKLTIQISSALLFITASIQPIHAQSMQLTLAPHGSKLIKNEYAFSLDAVCTVQSDQKNNHIKLMVMKNKGSVNGKALSEGQSTAIHMDDNNTLSVHADPGSEVNVSNLSDHPIQASCSV